MRIVIVFFLLLAVAFAQTCRATDILFTDTTHCAVKPFDSKRIQQYKSSPEFKYEKVKEPEGKPTWRSKFSKFINSIWEKLNGKEVAKISWYDILFYSLSVLAGLLIIFFFFRGEITGVFKRNPEIISTRDSYTENVHEMDFEQLITEAVSNNNYRLAIRLYYLSVLKALSDAELIKWQSNKTNFDYYYELRGEDRRRGFYELTGIFEYAWYGNNQISADDFNEHQGVFSGYLKTIKR